MYAAPTCTTVEAPVYVYCLYGSLLPRDCRGGYFHFRLSVPACVQWELKKFLLPTGNGLLLYAAAVVVYAAVFYFCCCCCLLSAAVCCCLLLLLLLLSAAAAASSAAFLGLGFWQIPWDWIPWDSRIPWDSTGRILGSRIPSCCCVCCVSRQFLNSRNPKKKWNPGILGFYKISNQQNV